MAEAKADAKAEAAPKSKKTILIVAVIGVLVFILILVGGLAFFLLKSPAEGSADEVTAEAAAHGQEKKKKKEKKNPSAPPIFDKLQDQPFTVNLSGEAESVLQVEIMVELAEAADKDKIKAVQPKVLDAVNRLLRSKTLEEVKTAEGQEELARQIRERINQMLEVEEKDEGVLSVNFTKYFYQ